MATVRTLALGESLVNAAYSAAMLVWLSYSVRKRRVKPSRTSRSSLCDADEEFSGLGLGHGSMGDARLASTETIVSELSECDASGAGTESSDRAGFGSTLVWAIIPGANAPVGHDGYIKENEEVDDAESSESEPCGDKTGVELPLLQEM
jgi:hypothetical protein